MPDTPKKQVHIDADEVQVTTTTEVPEGHVIVEPPTSATPAVTAPADAVREETVLRTQGQRDTSFLWENTQMRLALLMVGGFMGAHLVIVLSIGYLLVMHWEMLANNPGMLTPLVVILTATLGSISTLAAGVSATYFSRTNSHKVGGVEKGYEGR